MFIVKFQELTPDLILSHTIIIVVHLHVYVARFIMAVSQRSHKIIRIICFLYSFVCLFCSACLYIFVVGGYQSV